MHIDQIETPAITIDLDALEANITRLQTYLAEHHIANRPHIKTHKIPAVAHKQIAAGAVGITCQKLGEAEVMAAAGIEDIFLPYNIIGAAKLERLMALARQVTMSVTADSEFVVRGLSDAAHNAGLTLTVLVECDTGLGRAGVQSPQAAADLARVIARSRGLRFGGLMTFPNSDQFDAFMSEAKRLLAANGIPVERVSGGGTVSMWQAHTHPDLTEHRAGEYVYGSRAHIKSGVMKLENCSMRILATVVSRPTAERAVLDSGSKTLSFDPFSLGGFGHIVEYPDAKIHQLSEEHGHVDLSQCARKPEIGERVSIIPNHPCPVSNLFDEIYGVRDDIVELVWPVAARGAVR